VGYYRRVELSPISDWWHNQIDVHLRLKRGSWQGVARRLVHVAILLAMFLLSTHDQAVAQPSHRASCGSAVIAEYFSTGKVGRYGNSCYTDALRSLDPDARLYSGAVNAILAARFRASVVPYGGGANTGGSSSTEDDSTDSDAGSTNPARSASPGDVSTSGLGVGDTALARVIPYSSPYGFVIIAAGASAALIGLIALIIIGARRKR